jgi:hypothetical protein
MARYWVEHYDVSGEGQARWVRCAFLNHAFPGQDGFAGKAYARRCIKEIKDSGDDRKFRIFDELTSEFLSA